MSPANSLLQLFWNSPEHLIVNSYRLNRTGDYAFWRRRTVLQGPSLDDLGIKQRRVGSVTVLDIDSTLRISLKFGRSAVSLEKGVQSLLSSGQKLILLNLAGIRSISARGLGELVSIYVAVTKSGGQFKLFNLTATIRQLMSATNLSAVFAFYETEQEAIASFAGEPLSTNEIAAEAQRV